MSQITQTIRFAFAGFRHGHIMGLYNAVKKHPDLSIVAACEQDPATADDLRRKGNVRLTHANVDDLLKQVECDVVAIGDYYSARGPLAIAALRAGRHVIVDKPICTELEQLDEIARLAREDGRAVGCLLDLRGIASLQTMRRLIREGAVGEVHTVLFTAQHPLMLGSRPAWYFEPGKHCGTLNDIAIHATDAIPWITGRSIVAVEAARAWNARLPQFPHFQDAAQVMARLDNGGGLLGDVSYLAPEKCGYSVDQYWRFTCHGTNGVIETAPSSRTVLLATNDDKEPRQIPVDPAADSAGYVPLEDFLLDLRGQSTESSLTTAAVLDASRRALAIQKIADQSHPPRTL